jgi:hypothetical protein
MMSRPRWTTLIRSTPTTPEPLAAEALALLPGAFT